MMFGVVPSSSGPLHRKLEAWAAERGRKVIQDAVVHRTVVNSRYLRIVAKCERFAARRERFLQVLLRRAKSPEDESWLPPGARIIREVAAKYKMPVAFVTSHSRARWICTVRHEAAYEMACRTDLSLYMIGRALGGRRDHTSVLYGIHKYALRNGLPLPRGMRPRKRWLAKERP